MAGGSNTYGYVDGNPVSFYDLFGLAPGDKFATSEGAAIDMFAWIRANSGKGKRFDQTKEVSGWIVKVGKCYTYYGGSNDIVSGNNDTVRPPVKPGNAAALFHTHSLHPFPRGDQNLDFSIPGQIAGHPHQGDLSAISRKIDGQQYMGANEITGIDQAGNVSYKPIMRGNTGKNMLTYPIDPTRTPKKCGCQK